MFVGGSEVGGRRVRGWGEVEEGVGGWRVGYAGVEGEEMAHVVGRSGHVVLGRFGWSGQGLDLLKGLADRQVRGVY